GARDASQPTIQLLKDPSDMIASEMVTGLLQKVGMTSMPDVMAEQGTKSLERFAGELTKEQRERLDKGLQYFPDHPNANQEGMSASGGQLVPVIARAVVGQNHVDMISFYAAAIGVMFLLFTTSGAAGALLDEAESGTLDRVLSSRVTMTSLMLGKMAF